VNDDNTPAPPNYPPYASWGPEPEVHVHITAEKAEEPAWDWRWLQLGVNAGTAALAYLPAIVWARVLTDVHTQQGLAGAWFMAGGAVVVSVTRFVQKRNWTRRTLVWVAVLGGTFALPVFAEMVNILTGGAR
jgi:hypothetical protein